MPTTFTSASKSGRRDGGRHVRLGGEVEARPPARLGERVGERRRADVRARRARAAAATFSRLPVREVVDDDDLVAPREQGVDEVRADEAGAAGDDAARTCSNP